MCAGLAKGWIDKVGPKKVAAICTDNAENMRVSRELIVADRKYRHIVEIRYACQQYGFSDVSAVLLLCQPCCQVFARIVILQVHDAHLQPLHWVNAGSPFCNQAEQQQSDPG